MSSSSYTTKVARRSLIGIVVVIILVVVFMLVQSQRGVTVKESEASKKARLDKDNSVTITPYNTWRNDFCSLLVNLDGTLTELSDRNKGKSPSAGQLARKYADDATQTLVSATKPLTDTHFDSTSQLPENSLILTPTKNLDAQWNTYVVTITKSNEELKSRLDKAAAVAEKAPRGGSAQQQAAEAFSKSAEQAIKGWIGSVSSITPHTAPTEATQQQFAQSSSCKALKDKADASEKNPLEGDGITNGPGVTALTPSPNSTKPKP